MISTPNPDLCPSHRRSAVSRIIGLGVLLSGVAMETACGGSTYSAAPIAAQVVDAETNQPLEGVVVVAHWQLFLSSPGGRVPGEQLMVLETVTDNAGRFSFPAWGPKRAARGVLDDKDPALLLFKPGYEYQGLQNPTRSKLNTRSLRQSIWDGKTIALKPFKGELKEYASHLSFLHTSIRSILTANKCEWKHMPQLILAIDKQEKIFRNNNIYSPLYTVADLPESKCGSPKEFFQGLQK